MASRVAQAILENEMQGKLKQDYHQVINKLRDVHQASRRWKQLNSLKVQLEGRIAAGGIELHPHMKRFVGQEVCSLSW